LKSPMDVHFDAEKYLKKLKEIKDKEKKK